MGAGQPCGCRLRLLPEMRLADPRVFVEIKARGKRLAIGCMIANWRELPEGSISQIGIITGKKLGNSVVRSRARRLLRECFRLHQRKLGNPVQMVLVARQSIVHRKWGQVESDYLAILKQARLLNH